MNQELAAVTVGITAGKLDGPPLPVIGVAGKFQDYQRRMETAIAGEEF